MPTKQPNSTTTAEFDLEHPETWGPEKYGISLCIDRDISELRLSNSPVVIDVEDNESGSFVGIGLYSGCDVSYFTQLSSGLIRLLEQIQIVAHNGKSDLHKLRSWGVNVRAEQLVFDTMLASYVISSTKESHGLKELSHSELQIDYPSYRDLTGMGRNRKTLDLLPVELVAHYNALDCIVTYKLWQRYLHEMSPAQAFYFETIEMPINRLLFEMEQKGVKVDAAYLKDLDFRFGVECNDLLTTLRRYCGSDFNPRSPKQVSERLLRRINVESAKTGKEVLKGLEGIPLIKAFTRFRELTKLKGTYTEPLLELASRDEQSRIHTTFNQVAMTAQGAMKGIRTGRLSSSEPNLHNIPTRTLTGDMLRKAFVPSEESILIDADYSQIEWRLAAHFSEDPAMIKAVNSGDVYTALAAGVYKIKSEEVTKQQRRDVKTMALAMNFGAGGYKIAYVLNMPERAAFKLVDNYKAAFPKFFHWRRYIEAQPYVETLLGRRIVPESDSLKVPYMVQGSAADIIKLAMLRCSEHELLKPLLNIHDEMVFEVPRDVAHYLSQEVKEIMESVVKLSVPLIADVGIGSTWKEAKN